MWTGFVKQGESLYRIVMSSGRRREGKGVCKEEVRYEKYFREDGTFLGGGFRKDVARILEDLSKGKKLE